MRKFITIILLLFSVMASHAQAGIDNRIEELKNERAKLEMELKTVEDKLNSNRAIKGIGIGITIAGAIVFAPAILAGVPMWIAAPTKKWRWKAEKIQNRIYDINERIKDIEAGFYKEPKKSEGSFSR